jgi:hypothetical protein
VWVPWLYGSGGPWPVVLGISVFADAELLREFLQRPLKCKQCSGDINDGPFAKTAIAQCSDLVSKHFQQYPVCM